MIHDLDIRTTPLQGEVPKHLYPDTFPKGRVCCRCHYTILSIYNPSEACWPCGERFRQEAHEAELRRRDIEGRIERMPRRREQVASWSSVTQ